MMKFCDENLGREGLLWKRLITSPFLHPRPALFLDRDGVIIEERDYLSDPAGVALISGCTDVIRNASAAGFAVVVVSNQSGIGRGYFGWEEHRAIEDRLIELLAADGAAVDALLACGHHPSGVAPYNCDHLWRKPNPGMLLAAAEALNLDLPRSIMVGDKTSDIEAGRRAGVARSYHVLTGHGAEERKDLVAAYGADFQLVLIDSIAGLPTLLPNR